MPKRKDGSSLRAMLISLAAVLAVMIPIRCYQFVSGVLEGRTGFYSQSDWSIYVSYAVLVLAAAAFAALSLKDKRNVSYSRTAMRSTGLAIAAFMLALTLVIDAVYQYKVVIATVTDEAMTYATESVQYLKTGLVARGIEGFAAIVSAVFFVLFGVGHINGKSMASDSKLMALFPVIWCVCRLMHRFMRTVNFLNVSELLYELFMCVFLMAFFMAFAQLNSNVSSDGLDWKLTAYGLPAAMMCAVCFFPRFIVTLVGRDDCLCLQSPIEWCDLGTAVFIIALLLARLGAKEQIQAASESETDETESES